MKVFTPEREWLITNSLGGYASGTAAGINTRRYHGLLVAALHPPVQRMLYFAQLEVETSICVQLESFSFWPVPAWHFGAQSEHPGQPEHLKFTKRMLMPHGQNAVLINFHCSKPITLKLRPWLSARNFHGLGRRSDFNPVSRKIAGSLEIRMTAELPPLYFNDNYGLTLCPEPRWREFYYPEEAARGYECREELYCPGYFICELQAGTPLTLEAGLQPGEANWGERLTSERERRQHLFALAQAVTRREKMLCLSADSFVVQRDCPPGYSVIAGYPWFNDWGRDTLIALPGLSLATGRPHIAKSILLTFAAHLKSGLIPNCFGDDGTPSYNSIDAALWFVIALYRYLAATRDLELVGHLYPRLLEIISAFTHGTAYGIKTEDDGLISGGSPDTALTWMDAKAGDWVVTPRRGKAVEINALWFNSLMIMGVFGRKLNLGQDWRIQARRVKASFRRTFWNPGARCCYDVVSDQGRDATVRPNQIFSLSLPFALFGPREALDILTAVETHLLTPYGLRSLSPRDARYQPRYGGTLLQRDGAYHQGTVWAYLLGEYLKAGLKFRPGSLTRWRRALQPLLRHLEEAGLGSISEIFDGDPPHHPRGCIAQAWSVAEVLETLQLLKSPGKNAAGRRDKTNRAEVNTGSHK